MPRPPPRLPRLLRVLPDAMEVLRELAAAAARDGACGPLPVGLVPPPPPAPAPAPGPPPAPPPRRVRVEPPPPPSPFAPPAPPPPVVDAEFEVNGQPYDAAGRPCRRV